MRATESKKSKESAAPSENAVHWAAVDDKEWRWYEREGFVFEKEQLESTNGRVMKYYRWKKSA